MSSTSLFFWHPGTDQVCFLTGHKMNPTKKEKKEKQNKMNSKLMGFALVLLINVVPTHPQRTVVHAHAVAAMP